MQGSEMNFSIKHLIRRGFPASFYSFLYIYVGY